MTDRALPIGTRHILLEETDVISKCTSAQNEHCEKEASESVPG